MSNDKKQTPQEQTEDTDQKNKSDEKENGEAIAIADIKEAPEYIELNDKFIRLAAEFDNYKKRTAKEYNRLVETAESNLILSLLDVVDDFERALKHDTNDAGTFKQGVEMIKAKFEDILNRRGLKRMEVIDKQFDPNYHEAVMQLDSEEKEEGVILEEVQTGYYLHDKVLRPAKVVVAREKQPESGDEGKDE